MSGPSVDTAEAWWALALRVLGFALGAYLLIKQQALPATERDVWLQIIGAGCCGPVIAQSIATIIVAARGGEKT